MPSQNNEVRAERILDATAELVERFGYRKTTIDDIAKQAGVAKGTIYLHWKTREELFRALIYREELKLAEEIKQRVANDPEGATLHGMIKHATIVTMQRPLWKALLLRDTDMLGNLARAESHTKAYQESLASYQTYMEVLRSQGLIRTDMSIKEQIYTLSAISIGFLLIDTFMPDDLKFSDEEIGELLAETIRRTFEPRGAQAEHEPNIIDKRQGTVQAFNQYIDQAIDAMKEQSQREVES